MIVKKPSRVNGTERNVTPMRAGPSFSNFRSHGSKRSRGARRGRQRSKFSGYGCGRASFRVQKPGGGCLKGGPWRDHGEQGPAAAGGSRDFSQDSTSLTMPSGVSSFLLDCLDVDSLTSVEDSTLSSIEEFRKADNDDGGSTLYVEAGLMSAVKNSTLLDLSHAQDLELQLPPNLSSILELSVDAAEDEEMSPVRLSPVRMSSEALASGVVSGGVLRPLDERTRPVDPTPAERKCFAEKGKVIKCRKVTFSDVVSVRDVSSHKCDQRRGQRGSGGQRGARGQRGSGGQQDEQVQPDRSASESSDIPSGPVRFFDFADLCERDAFFHRLKQTRSFMFPARPILSPI